MIDFIQIHSNFLIFGLMTTPMSENYKFWHDYVVVTFKELYFDLTASILACNISRKLNLLMMH